MRMTLRLCDSAKDAPQRTQAGVAENLESHMEVILVTSEETIHDPVVASCDRTVQPLCGASLGRTGGGVIARCGAVRCCGIEGRDCRQKGAGHVLLRVREPSLVDPDVTQRHLEDCPPTQGLRTEIEPLVPPPGFGLGAGGLEYPRFLDEFPHPCLVILVTEGSGQDSVMQLEADGLVVMLKEVHAPVVVMKQLEGRISQDAEVPLRAPGSVCHALCAQHLVSRPCKACLCQPCQHIVVAPMRRVHGDPATQGMPRVARGVEPDLRRPTHIGNVVQRRSWLPPRDFEASRPCLGVDYQDRRERPRAPAWRRSRRAAMLV